MAEQPARSTRRQAIKQTALAAGVIWTAPAIKTVRVLGATGTPEPPTSATSPPVTHYEFHGQFASEDRNFVVTSFGNPQCPWSGSGGLSPPQPPQPTLPPMTAFFSFCLPSAPVGAFDFSGIGELGFNEGTLDGSIVGAGHQFGPDPTQVYVNFVFTITDSDQMYEGATGMATYDEHLVTPGGTDVVGELFVAFDVPS